MVTLFGNRMGKCIQFCFLIVDTDLLKKVHEGKTRKAMVIE